MTFEERKAEYLKFHARAEFVKDLAELQGLSYGENGNLVFNDAAKETSFYEMLAEYDDNVRHFETMNEADHIDAEADAAQGTQALTDDDWERREEQERDDEHYAYLAEE